jgi:hypothetical protein
MVLIILDEFISDIDGGCERDAWFDKHKVDIDGSAERDIWNTHWRDGSVLPQRASFTDTHRGDTHVIGILHHLLHNTTTVHELPTKHSSLASVLIPHCGFLNTSMFFT